MRHTGWLPVVVPVVVAAVMASLAAMAPASAAVAANDLVLARPLVNERVDARPDAVTVALEDPARGTTKLVVEDASGRTVSIEPATVVSTNASIQLPDDLAPGVYTVVYRTDTRRGPVGGSFQFAYDSDAAFDFEGVRTWQGYSEVPKQVAAAGDAAKAAAEPSASPGGATGESPDASAGPDASPDASTSGPNDAEDAVDPASAEDDAPWWPWVLGGIALVAVLAGLALRRRGDGTDA